jgi:Exocyst complex component Sec10
MLRFTFSPTGALRWQCDLRHYAAALDVGIPSVPRLFDDLHALATLLLLNVDSLRHVVPGMVRAGRLGPGGGTGEEVPVQAVLEAREDWRAVEAVLLTERE